MIIGISLSPVKFHRNNRIDWLIAAAVAAGSFALYLGTLAPDILPGDAGEFQVAAWRLGLSHATGYPLYMILGSVWQHLLALFAINAAVALNALSAVFAALAVAVTYLILLDVPVTSSLTRRIVALFAASLLAVNQTFWSQAIIAEVYSLHTLLMLILLLILQRSVISDPHSSTRAAISPRGLTWAALVFGLSLTHHAMTLLMAPAILIYLWAVDPAWWRMSWRRWLVLLAILLAPLALYAYVPVRGGPGASPWYHQPLGASTLNLYAGDWSSTIDFVTGHSISVGFHSARQAFANAPQAIELWRQHFGVLGLLLIALGVYTMAVLRREFLWLTAGIAIPLQLFVLFYAIGDIDVYYIPLYAIGAIWAGYGAAGLSDGMLLRLGQGGQGDAGSPGWGHAGAIIALVLFLLPVSTFLENSASVDQAGNHTARLEWERILAARPEDGAILVSNDRNDIPPLFYLQYVEGIAPALTALHPLMRPDERFADVGATVDTALREGGGAAVYLIKPMPGLEIKFDLEPAQEPLMRVAEMESPEPAYFVDHALGELTLIGYDWEPSNGDVLVRLYWSVDGSLDADYTTSVQLFDADENRLAQSDRQPGGVYYPTSLWKPGERLVEEHVLPMDPSAASEITMQVGMYAGPSLTQLAQPLRMQTPNARQ